MKKNAGFTLLEVLISLSISTVIILGMLQIYQNATNYFGKANEFISLSRKVYILFGQLENDLTTAFVSKFHEKIKDKKDEKEEPKKSKEEYKYFIGQIYDDQTQRIKGKTWELFKSLNFINTNPLQIYSKKYPRLVRVKYELIKNKEKSEKEKIVYSLYRKETLDLQNVDFKESEEFFSKEKKELIRNYLIADNIKEFFVEYIFPQETEKDNKKEKEFIRSFVWPSKEIIAKMKDAQAKKVKEQETDAKSTEQKKDQKPAEKDKGILEQVPAKIEIFISFWDVNLERSNSFNCLIPVYSYPTLKETKEANPEDKKKAEEEKKKAEAQKQNGQKVAMQLVKGRR
ncbi:prepilin-type N-terminal cleavage/methylation domain-containing protein [Candidatus Babeliales bacterium]|nr:prepilin-type N-terminal cleavage/methylation domain-containing protein [Candidatus Babeliales bacterium]MCF7899757.1 prepilin-type N-terminal cleavage/methylation domain-containing protein [Candidatus Babeliales bacterium]